jgi:signal peptidase I
VDRPASRIRRRIENTILLLIGLVMLHTWFVEGFPVACQVDGASMATALLGRHVDLTCPHCEFAFACDADQRHDPHYWSEGATVACPNCAASFEPGRPQTMLPGDRVLIDRSAFQFRRPRRWEVVAIDRSEEGEGLAVKRVVGLPGEKVRLKGGRVYINDALVRRDLRQQRAMRILLHDDQFISPRILTNDYQFRPRWRPQDFGSNWTRHEGRPVHTESPNDEIGWLVYNHQDAADGGDKPSFVSDYGYYNRGRMQLRRESVHYTPDVAMSFRLQDVHGRGMIWLRATDGRDEFIVQIDPAEKTFAVRKNRGKEAIGSGGLPGPLRGETLEVSLIDRQFLFAVGSKTLFTAAIDTPGEPPLSKQPLAVGVQGLGVSLDRLRVYRAIYYGGPPGRDQWPAPTCTVGPEEYFVLGDNNPISEDSRTWSDQRLPSHKSLAGKPFVVIYPSCGFSLGPWHIQVPDLTRIRYIR